MVHRDAPSKVALAALTRTRGSTFRRPGTRMLVFGDGQVVRELSGGCPQRDIVARAKEVIASATPRLVRYNAQSGLDVLMEKGCGGELEVLIEPLTTTHDTDFIDTLWTFFVKRQPVHVATLFAIDEEAVKPQRLVWNEHTVLRDSTAAHALFPLASALGWQTTLVDHDPERLKASDLPTGLKTVCASPSSLPGELPLDSHSWQLPWKSW